MASALPPSQLEEASRVVEAQLGLHFSPERWTDLERGLRGAAHELGFSSLEEFIRCILARGIDRKQADALAGQLTIGETYFLRDAETFEAISRHLIPRLIEDRAGHAPRLRIWSAGCCTGEEPYSIAITLRRTLPDIDQWQISILATDVNPRFLHKAKLGIYRDWSFRGVPEDVRRRWFRSLPDGSYEIVPEIRRMVAFEYLNLVEDLYPSLTNNTNAMDLIFCRNVLIYFSPEQLRKVVQKLRSSLVEGGRLLVSAAEGSQEHFENLAPERIEGLALYRKGPASIPSIAIEEPWDQPEFIPEPFPQPRPAAPTPPVPIPHIASIADARRLANEGDLAKARATCDQLLIANKLDPALHYLRGVILQEQGELDTAATAFQRALFLDPNFIIAYFSLGHLHLRQGRDRQAERCFGNARSLLRTCDPNLELPESEGMTAGRLLAILTSTEEALI